MELTDIKSLDLDELTEYIVSLGEPKFRAKQLYEWMHVRLVPGYDAPTELTWTENNQNSLVRIPVTRGEGIRVELRSPDTSANPYVVLAICLAAGLDGIKNKITPTKSSNLAMQGLKIAIINE